MFASQHRVLTRARVNSESSARRIVTYPTTPNTHSTARLGNVSGGVRVERILLTRHLISTCLPPPPSTTHACGLNLPPVPRPRLLRRHLARHTSLTLTALAALRALCSFSSRVAREWWCWSTAPSHSRTLPTTILLFSSPQRPNDQHSHVAVPTTLLVRRCSRERDSTTTSCSSSSSRGSPWMARAAPRSFRSTRRRVRHIPFTRRPFLCIPQRPLPFCFARTLLSPPPYPLC